MAKQLFSNGASAKLAVTINNTDTSVQVQAGYGALYPSPTGGDWFMVTLEDSNANIEVVKCTARTGDLLTVVRGQEGTSAQSFTNTVTRVECRNTRGSMERLLQRSGDTLGGNLGLGGFELTGPGSVGTGVDIPAESVFPVGMIVMWSGSIGSIPAGWALCDGTGGTPDLRSKFVLGAGSIYSVGQTGGSATSASVTAASGAHSHGGVTGGHALTESEMPSHTHNVGYRGSNASSTGSDTDFVTPQGDPRLDGQVATAATGGGAAHTHTIASESAHTHDINVAIMPPYFALAFIMFTG